MSFLGVIVILASIVSSQSTCSWSGQFVECPSLTENTAATTSEACKTACCDDAACQVWQFSTKCFMGEELWNSPCMGDETFSEGGRKVQDLWPQSSLTKVKGHRCVQSSASAVASQLACQNQADSNGHGFYQYYRPQLKCLTAATCDATSSGSSGWQIYHKARQVWVERGCSGSPVGSWKSELEKAGAALCCGATSCTAPEACPKFLTFEAASDLCKRENKRLCTKEELVGGKCCNTGGNCDSHMAWTLTTDQARFVFGDAGSDKCATSHTPITTLKECEEAALSLGLLFAEVSESPGKALCNLDSGDLLEKVHFDVTHGATHAQTKLVCKKADYKYYILPRGISLCPDADRIKTNGDCELAMAALGLVNQRTATDSDNLPGGCSTRQWDTSASKRYTMFLNTAEPGSTNEDVSPICKKAPSFCSSGKEAGSADDSVKKTFPRIGSFHDCQAACFNDGPMWVMFTWFPDATCRCSLQDAGTTSAAGGVVSGLVTCMETTTTTTTTTTLPVPSITLPGYLYITVSDPDLFTAHAEIDSLLQKAVSAPLNLSATAVSIKSISLHADAEDVVVVSYEITSPLVWESEGQTISEYIASAGPAVFLKSVQAEVRSAGLAILASTVGVTAPAAVVPSEPDEGLSNTILIIICASVALVICCSLCGLAYWKLHVTLHKLIETQKARHPTLSRLTHMPHPHMPHMPHMPSRLKTLIHSHNAFSHKKFADRGDADVSKQPSCVISPQENQETAAAVVPFKSDRPSNVAATRIQSSVRGYQARKKEVKKKGAPKAKPKGKGKPKEKAPRKTETAIAEAVAAHGLEVMEEDLEGRKTVMPSPTQLRTQAKAQNKAKTEAKPKSKSALKKSSNPEEAAEKETTGKSSPRKKTVIKRSSDSSGRSKPEAAAEKEAQVTAPLRETSSDTPGSNTAPPAEKQAMDMQPVASITTIQTAESAPTVRPIQTVCFSTAGDDDDPEASLGVQPIQTGCSTEEVQSDLEAVDDQSTEDVPKECFFERNQIQGLKPKGGVATAGKALGKVFGHGLMGLGNHLAGYHPEASAVQEAADSTDTAAFQGGNVSAKKKSKSKKTKELASEGVLSPIGKPQLDAQ